MFTGLIEEVGTLLRVQRASHGARLMISAHQVLEDTRIGDSIAVNGVCLTVTELHAQSFGVDVVAETLARSSLGQTASGALVNLERAMRSDGRFGGHVVAGHVDDTGIVQQVHAVGSGRILSIRVSKSLTRYIVEKGSITVDGVSLTVMSCDEDGFQISLIPHSSGSTTLGSVRIGERVNIEVDVLAKYVEKLLGQQGGKTTGPLSYDQLRDWGY